MTQQLDATPTSVPDTSPAEPQDDQLVAEDLVEEVSIDGMCGVY